MEHNEVFNWLNHPMDENSWLLPESIHASFAGLQDDDAGSQYWAQDLDIDMDIADPSQFSLHALVASENEVLDGVINNRPIFEHQFRELISLPWNNSSEQLPPSVHYAIRHPLQPQSAFTPQLDSHYGAQYPLHPQPAFTPQLDNHYAAQHPPQPQPAPAHPQSRSGSRPSGISIVRFIPYQNPVYQGRIVNEQMQQTIDEPRTASTPPPLMSGQTEGAGVINFAETVHLETHNSQGREHGLPTTLGMANTSPDAGPSAIVVPENQISSLENIPTLATSDMIIKKTRHLLELSVLTTDCRLTFGPRVKGQRNNQFWEESVTCFQQNNYRIDPSLSEADKQDLLKGLQNYPGEFRRSFKSRVFYSIPLMFDLLPVGDALPSPEAREIYIKNSARKFLEPDNPFLPDRTGEEGLLDEKMVRALETIIFYSLFWGGDQLVDDVRSSVQAPVGYRNGFASHCRSEFPVETLVLITMLVVVALRAYSCGEGFRFSISEQKDLYQTIQDSFKTNAGKGMRDIISLHMGGSAPVLE